MRVGRRAGALLLAGALAAACGGGGGSGAKGQGGGDSGGGSGLAATTTTSKASARATRPLSGIDLKLTRVMSVDSPTSLVSRPHSTHLYVAERAGRVRQVDDLEPGPVVLDISSMVVADVERGLLDIEFSPDGGTLYVSYSLAPNGDTRVASYAMDGDKVDVGSRKQLIAVRQPFANHNGGDIEFGPDGDLYLGLGDGGSVGDPFRNAQNTHVLLGKLLRVDPNAPSGGKPYGIPRDNPFADGQGGAPEVYAYGLRNPWRYTFDPATGDLWIADVGQNLWEEVDMLPKADGAGKGDNFGWNQLEGTHSYQGGTKPAGAVDPVFEYSHQEGCSVTGGVVYRGTNIPGLGGTYLLTDYCQGRIRGLRVAGGKVSEQKEFDASGQSLVSFGTDPAGNVYVISLNGPIYRLDPA